MKMRVATEAPNKKFKRGMFKDWNEYELVEDESGEVRRIDYFDDYMREWRDWEFSAFESDFDPVHDQRYVTVYWDGEESVIDLGHYFVDAHHVLKLDMLQDVMYWVKELYNALLSDESNRRQKELFEKKSKNKVKKWSRTDCEYKIEREICEDFHIACNESAMGVLSAKWSSA